MPMPLRAIAVFHAVARNGSLTKAASELFVTSSAISQQIQNLEEHLGTTLLAKAGRGVVLTEAGERYYEMIAGDIERIAEATQRIRGIRSRAVLVVRSTPSLATKWLRPRLGSFLDANPGIELRLNGTNEPTDFLREAVDVEIRHGEGRWPGLFVEGLADESFLPVCSPSLAAPNSLRPADVCRHRLIYSFRSQVQWPQWFALAGVAQTEATRRVLFDRSHMSVDAAADGMGVALESTLMMWRELGSGALVCPVRSPPPIRLTTQWIACPSDHLNKSKVKAFIDWVRAEQRDWQEKVSALFTAADT